MRPTVEATPLEVESEAVTAPAAENATPLEHLTVELAADMDAVNVLIRERMSSQNAPRIPEVTAHLIEAGGKRLRPLLTLAASRRWLSPS